MSYNRCLNDNKIIVLEEDDCNDEGLSYLERGLRRLRNARQNGQSIPYIDLTRSEEEQRVILEYESQIMARLGPTRHRRPVLPLRNPSMPGRSRISSFRHEDFLIKQGTVVQVRERPRNEYSWEFVRVSEIYVDNYSRNVVLHGIRLTRHRNLRGMLLKMKNEVCALYDIDQGDSRPEHVQATVEIPVTEVIKTRAFCQTNAAPPAHRFDPGQWKSIEEIESKGVLVQRWKFCRYWPTSGAIKTKKSVKGAFIRLRSADIEDEYFVGGQACIPAVNLDMAEDNPSAVATLGRQQMYTADDMFCGAGGAACGIRQAGLRISTACDQDNIACMTYRLNFPEATLKQMDIAELNKESESLTPHPDLVHISPPCQVWSPAHTRIGKNDEANAAALLACEDILRTRRPRLSTGEQTFGLLFDGNEECFNALVGQYTRLGYSFSWDILYFKEYGIPSTRKRLIWIASCPGEALPPFPMPTHGGNDGSLPAPVTVRDALASIKPSIRNPDRLHDVKDMLLRAKKSAKFPRTAWNDRRQIGTITTSGSKLAHPSGEREFTRRELACLQGFPNDYQFAGNMTEVSRQIGNAFPPVVVEILYSHLRNWLLCQDLVVFREHQKPQDIIVIDPIEDTVVAPRPAGSGNPIPIDNDDGQQYRDQVGSEQRTGGRIKDAILVDGPEDMDMTDAIDDYRNFSRASSRTLSAESLPSLMEMEIDTNEEARARPCAPPYRNR
ncbi:hypothetical protein EKO27_g8652 [Xylaria grammica]|uniref:DNA (cytosine-5-)-methyltransferase n=1 Tax=Xylaria grammica TaxID=363999 RepID=A0A439CWM4_9PEZI|nr:hypothetical protein EKO27_g8652 [Xylaria grammica]